MKTISESPYTFSFVPLISPQISDDLIIELRNEISNLLIIEACNWTENLGRIYLTIPAPQVDFAIGNKYSFVIKNSTTPIYYGKLTVLSESTDIQNFEYGNKFYTE
jgi:hypothetical protein